MLITIIIISIFAITVFIWLLNKVLPFRICPICAGVSGTWLWLLAARFFGYQIDLIFPAALMGGSVVGIAYQLEKTGMAQKSPILFKTLFISIGFIAVYGLLLSRYPTFLTAIIFLIALSLLFFKTSIKNTNGKNQKIKELENKMEDCC